MIFQSSTPEVRYEQHEEIVTGSRTDELTVAGADLTPEASGSTSPGVCSDAIPPGQPSSVGCVVRVVSRRWL